MIKLLLFFTIGVYLFPGTCSCQFTSQDSLQSTIGLKFKPALMLPDFKPVIDLKYGEDIKGEIDPWQWISPLKQITPFQLDMRSSSYYVPRQVRDELNLIMNRPRETAFVPVLSIAYLAYQLAQQYLVVRLKTAITPADLLSAEDNTNILEILWEKSPQTITEIYDSLPGLNPTVFNLEKKLNMLQDAKLIRSKKNETQTLYFPAVSKNALHEKLTEALEDSTLTENQINILQTLLYELN